MAESDYFNADLWKPRAEPLSEEEKRTQLRTVIKDVIGDTLRQLGAELDRLRQDNARLGREHEELAELVWEVLPALSRDEYGELEDRCGVCGVGRGSECGKDCARIKLAALVGTP